MGAVLFCGDNLKPMQANFYTCQYCKASVVKGHKCSRCGAVEMGFVPDVQDS